MQCVHGSQGVKPAGITGVQLAGITGVQRACSLISHTLSSYSSRAFLSVVADRHTRSYEES